MTLQGEKGISNVKGEGEDDQRRSLHDAQVHYVGKFWIVISWDSLWDHWIVDGVGISEFRT